ncbi:MAG: low specificity L-threonine aldolase [Alphaproteobacteria bacterium]|nr:low specificity L-threonine aldolase [Alphaproteobacteria bacterium]
MAVALKPSPVAPVVTLASDGEELSPAAYAQLLAELTRGRDVAADTFSIGGIVAEFEARIAGLLGKERAIVMPTGTLANMLALDRLAGPAANGVGRRRVIVQTDSHVLNDTGDGCELVAGLKLVPVQDHGAGFTAAAVRAELQRATTARVAVPFGAISIETPVRRRHNELVDQRDIDEVVALARAEGIGLHLDGARVFIAAAATGRSVADCARPFDTVYVSLYKYMHVPFGAVLAGPARLIDGLHHDRRRHGGGLRQSWQIALVAGHFLDDLESAWRQAMVLARPVLDRIVSSGRARLADFPNAGNIFPLVPVSVSGAVDSQHLARVAARALALGIKLPEPEGDRFWIRVNATWTRLAPDDLAARVVKALES